ncbi:MAG: lipocalin-like domain-containing protein [Bacteroidales bacterium]
MKSKSVLFFLITIILSCTTQETEDLSDKNQIQLNGTWKLISGTIILKGDSTVTDYTKNVSFVKIINNSHFAFLQHDLQNGKDSGAVFVAGGGKYELKDSIYTEHLEYCSAREWEGNDFRFIVTLKNDTLTQKGIEKVEKLGIEQVNIEKYVRVRD